MLYRSANIRRKRPHNRQGAAYVIALVTLLVGTTLSLALLRASMGQFTSENARQKGQAAADLAEAGVDYAYWQVMDKNKTLPYSADITLNTGSFHVDAVDDGARQPGAVMITATGTIENRSHTMKRVIGKSDGT